MTQKTGKNNKKVIAIAVVIGIIVIAAVVFFMLNTEENKLKRSYSDFKPYISDWSHYQENDDMNGVEFKDTITVKYQYSVDDALKEEELLNKNLKEIIDELCDPYTIKYSADKKEASFVFWGTDYDVLIDQEISMKINVETSEILEVNIEYDEWDIEE